MIVEFDASFEHLNQSQMFHVAFYLGDSMSSKSRAKRFSTIDSPWNGYAGEAGCMSNGVGEGSRSLSFLIENA
jgi:hypothetical protein